MCICAKESSSQAGIVSIRCKSRQIVFLFPSLNGSTLLSHAWSAAGNTNHLLRCDWMIPSAGILWEKTLSSIPHREHLSTWQKFSGKMPISRCHSRVEHMGKTLKQKWRALHIPQWIAPLSHRVWGTDSVLHKIILLDRTNTHQHRSIHPLG